MEIGQTSYVAAEKWSDREIIVREVVHTFY